MDRIPGILLLYHRPFFGKVASTILENVAAFREYSRFPVWEVNTEIGLPKNLPRLRFDIIILHYSLFGRGYEYELSDKFLEYLAACHDSYKIAFFQDEYRFCQKRFAFINNLDIDTVYTCLDPQYHKDVYYKYTKVKHVEYYIPGYVSNTMISIASRFQRPITQRPIDIGYRARRLDFYMGKGAQEKHEIGLEVKRLCRERGLPLKLDINVEEKNRLYDDDWYGFMANCKGMLGVESGVTIFDLNDEVRIACDNLIKTNPAITFNEVYDNVLYRWENNIPLRTISPRHFEAAAFKICQILFEGSYSDILKPDIHYISLKKDFSNFDRVIEMFRDQTYRSEIIENAYRDLIVSGKCSYQAFIQTFDNHLSGFGLRSDSKLEKCNIDKILYADMQTRRAKAFAKNLIYIKFPGRGIIRNVISKLYPRG